MSKLDAFKNAELTANEQENTQGETFGLLGLLLWKKKSLFSFGGSRKFSGYGYSRDNRSYGDSRHHSGHGYNNNCGGSYGCNDKYGC